jgi:formyl-CoA transferase
MWPLLARNKKSVVLDLRSPEGAQAARRMITETDVIIVNMPAGLLARIALDWPTLSAINPGLIYVQVSGFGLDGPYADRPGNGTLGEAMAGLTHMTGDADGPPVAASLPLGDAVTALVGAFGVLAACYHRLAHAGTGQVIDVNPVDAMLLATGPMLSSYGPASGVPGRLGSGLPGSQLRNVFAGKDGKWIAISASTPRHAEALAGLSGPSSARGPSPSPDQLERAVREWAAGLDRDEALAILVERRVPAARVNDAADILSDPHLRARHSIVEIETAEFGTVYTPAPAPRLTRTPGVISLRTARPGEHQEALTRGQHSHASE